MPNSNNDPTHLHAPLIRDAFAPNPYIHYSTPIPDLNVILDNADNMDIMGVRGTPDDDSWGDSSDAPKYFVIYTKIPYPYDIQVDIAKFRGVDEYIETMKGYADHREQIASRKASWAHVERPTEEKPYTSMYDARNPLLIPYTNFRVVVTSSWRIKYPTVYLKEGECCILPNSLMNGLGVYRQKWGIALIARSDPRIQPGYRLVWRIPDSIPLPKGNPQGRMRTLFNEYKAYGHSEDVIRRAFLEARFPDKVAAVEEFLNLQSAPSNLNADGSIRPTTETSPRRKVLEDEAMEYREALARQERQEGKNDAEFRDTANIYTDLKPLVGADGNNPKFKHTYVQIAPSAMLKPIIYEICQGYLTPRGFEVFLEGNGLITIRPYVEPEG